MPMLGRIAAMSGAAGHVDDSSAPRPRTEMRDRETAEIGRGLKVDLHCALPGREPDFHAFADRDRLVDTGVVDQDIDPSVQSIERSLPEFSAAPACERSAAIWSASSPRVP